MRANDLVADDDDDDDVSFETRSFFYSKQSGFARNGQSVKVTRDPGPLEILINHNEHSIIKSRFSRVRVSWRDEAAAWTWSGRFNERSSGFHGIIYYLRRIYLHLSERKQHSHRN